MIEVGNSASKLRRWSHTHSFFGGLGLGLFVLLFLGLGIILGFARSRSLLLHTVIAGVEVGGMSGEDAAFVLAQKIGASEGKLSLVSDKQVWILNRADLGLEYDLPSTINQAWVIGREGPIMDRISQISRTLMGRTRLNLVVTFDEEKLSSFVASVAAQLDDPAIEPSLKIQGRGENREVVLDRGKDGVELDRFALAEEIKNSFADLSSTDLKIEAKQITVSLDEEQARAALALGNSFLDKTLTVQAPDEDDWAIAGVELIPLLSLTSSGFNQLSLTELVDDYAEAVNRPPQNAAFRFNSGKVEEFRPAREGLEVDRTKLLSEINQNFERLQKESVTMNAPVALVAPTITTESVNDLGIKERLGRGDSTYLHSIPNRIYNVSLTASRLDGIIVAPGETFSFNNAIGDISAATGFKAAYVIKDGRTVLGDGGGVCQVSTTLFRAILNAGLPIVERKAHSYRVGYYEQNSPPGIDATVYAPSADLKFTNNTPAHLLIQATNDPKTQELVIDIYGTTDGRLVEMTEPTIWGQSPPPPALYQDDPSLAPGQVKQVDWAASGAKTKFDYKVTRGGEVLFEKTFYSTYRPWQAVYLRGPQI